MVNIAADYSSLAVVGKENMSVYSPKSPTAEEPDKVRGSKKRGLLNSNLALTLTCSQCAGSSELVWL